MLFFERLVLILKADSAVVEQAKEERVGMVFETRLVEELMDEMVVVVLIVTKQPH